MFQNVPADYIITDSTLKANKKFHSISIIVFNFSCIKTPVRRKSRDVLTNRKGTFECILRTATKFISKLHDFSTFEKDFFHFLRI